MTRIGGGRVDEGIRKDILQFAGMESYAQSIREIRRGIMRALPEEGAL